METVSQLSLPLFAPTTFDELIARRHGGDILSVVVNKRLRRGWRVRTRPFSKTRQLIIPPYLFDAPEEIKNCLVEWAFLPYRAARAKKAALREKRTSLEKKVWRYVESLPRVPLGASRFNPKRFAGATAGAVYDLREVFNAVNAAWFNGKLHALVRWGDASSKTSYHTAKVDTAGTRIDLITIAGVYNHPRVPRFAIEAIMRHEMLHIAIPPYRKNGRTVIHGQEFKKEERKFTRYREWRRWERDQLTLLMKRRWIGGPIS
jgi:hypothetical protein